MAMFFWPISCGEHDCMHNLIHKLLQLSSLFLQIYQVAQLHHGLMMVGHSDSCKSTHWNILLMTLECMEGVEGAFCMIKLKAIPRRISVESWIQTLLS